jgi:phosphatidylglycerophosphate synthase
VAALTLLDRLVVTVHRAGCSQIRVVCEGELPALKRAQALGVSVDLVKEIPRVNGRTLVAGCAFVTQPEDLRRVMAARGRLVDRHGQLLPAGVIDNFEGGLETALALLPKIRSEGLTAPVRDVASARRAASQLWDSLASSTDGFVDKYFNRPLGRYVSKALVHTPVTPNQVTVISTFIGLAGAYYFSQGTHSGGIAGALLLQASALFDCVDGEVARIGFKESAIGKWLDIALDQVVHVAVFAAIAIGLWRQGSNAPVLWLGASAVAGALISFLVVMRGRRLASREQNSRLERFIDMASTRDFTALLIALALIDRLTWFLWATAITVHVFWTTALSLQFSGRRDAVVSSVND